MQLGLWPHINRVGNFPDLWTESETLLPIFFFLPLCFHMGQICLARESLSLPFPAYDTFILDLRSPNKSGAGYCLLFVSWRIQLIYQKTEFPALVIK